MPNMKLKWIFIRDINSEDKSRIQWKGGLHSESACKDEKNINVCRA